MSSDEREWKKDEFGNKWWVAPPDALMDTVAQIFRDSQQEFERTGDSEALAETLTNLNNLADILSHTKTLAQVIAPHIGIAMEQVVVSIGGVSTPGTDDTERWLAFLDMGLRDEDGDVSWLAFDVNTIATIPDPVISVAIHEIMEGVKERGAWAGMMLSSIQPNNDDEHTANGNGTS